MLQGGRRRDALKDVPLRRDLHLLSCPRRACRALVGGGAGIASMGLILCFATAATRFGVRLGRAPGMFSKGVHFELRLPDGSDDAR